MQERLFGHTDYAHPVLRWMSVPLFRLSWIAFLVNLVRGGIAAWFYLWMAMLALSIAAQGLNYALLRRRPGPRPAGQA